MVGRIRSREERLNNGVEDRRPTEMPSRDAAPQCDFCEFEWSAFRVMKKEKEERSKRFNGVRLCEREIGPK